MADAKPVDSVERAKSGDAALRRENAQPEDRTRNLPYDTGKAVLKYGVIGGVLLAAYQVAMINVDAGKAIGYSVAGVALLFPVLYFALREYRDKLAGGEVFKNGVIHSLKISVIASLFMGAATILIGLLGHVPGDTEQALETPGMAFLQGFFLIIIGTVVGMIVAFILLQGMKSGVPADENIEKVEGHA